MKYLLNRSWVSMRYSLMFLLLLPVMWITPHGGHAQASSSASAFEGGLHWEGLYPGMLAEDMVRLLDLGDDWYRWCRSTNGRDPYCFIDGDQTKYGARHIKFGISLTSDSSRVTMVYVALSVADRDSAEAVIRNHLARWAVNYPPLGDPSHSWLSGVCFFSSQSAVWGTWMIEVTCRDNRRGVISDEESPVQEVELSFTLRNPNR